MSDYNSFQDVIKEELIIEETVAEDEFEESLDMLDIVMSENDERRVDDIKTNVDSFLEDVDREVDLIEKGERLTAMDELMEYLEESEILEETLDVEIEDLDELECSDIDGDSIDDDGEMIDTIEGLPSLDSDLIDEEE